MRQLFVNLLVTLILVLGSSSVSANTYDEAYAERLKAAKNYARARVLVAGIKGSDSIRKKIYSSAIGNVEKHLTAAIKHVSKSRELLLKGHHSGEIDKESEAKLRGYLKKQKVEIAELRSSIDELNARYSDKPAKTSSSSIRKPGKTAVKGLKREVIVGDFLDWLDFLTKLRKEESVNWKDSAATNNLWREIAGDNGFYQRHIDLLGDSVIYADNREQTSREDYDYVRAGMKRFMDYHDHLIAILGKIETAYVSGALEQKKKAESYARLYMSADVFSGLPSHKKLPSLPIYAAEDVGYIPAQSMMTAFSTVPKKPSLAWIKKDNNTMQVLRALYDRGFAHDFLKKLVNHNGRFNVYVTGEGEDAEIVYQMLDNTLYIPRGKFHNGKLKITTELLPELLHALFRVYSNEVIDEGNDPLTKNLLVNTELWLKEQFIREIDDGSSKTWTDFNEVVSDSKAFTVDYVAKIIKVSFSAHMSIWNKVHQLPRGSRITPWYATKEWRQAESSILNNRYLVSQYGDRNSWEVQSVPPDFVMTYIQAFYNLGEY